MKKLYTAFFWALCLCSSILCRAQVNTTIVVLGSSTAAGQGASPNDSSWVGRLQSHFRKNTAAGNPDTTVINLAVGGSNTYNIMPTGFTSPGKPTPDPERNVTKALSFNPELIIINMPSNDIGAGYTANEFMNNLRLLFQHINNAGPRAFITTTQPRTFYTDAERLTLRNLVDSINNNFGVYAIDFWTDVVTTDGQNRLRSELNSGDGAGNDGTHLNNLGHRLVFQRVIAKNLFAVTAPLPVKLASFKGRLINNAVELTWATEDEEQGTRFVIQKSKDGLAFENAFTQAGVGNGQGSYKWTDRSAFSGNNIYRLEIIEGSRKFYSNNITIKNEKGFGIKKLYQPGGSILYTEIELSKTGMAIITVQNAAGQTVFESKVMLSEPSTVFQLPLNKLAAGRYFLHIVTSENEKASVSFIK